MISDETSENFLKLRERGERETFKCTILERIQCPLQRFCLDRIFRHFDAYFSKHILSNVETNNVMQL